MRWRMSGQGPRRKRACVFLVEQLTMASPLERFAPRAPAAHRNLKRLIRQSRRLSQGRHGCTRRQDVTASLAVANAAVPAVH